MEHQRDLLFRVAGSGLTVQILNAQVLFSVLFSASLDGLSNPNERKWNITRIRM